LACLGQIADFLIKASVFSTNFRSADIESFKAEESDVINYNSVINISVMSITEPHKTIADFEGLAFDFFTDSRFFNLLDYYSPKVINKIISNFKVDDQVHVDLTDGQRAIVILRKSTSYI
jgi:hypothetical protein